MNCVRCDREIDTGAAYCQHCGARQQEDQPVSPRYLRRSRADRQIAGVCGGIARYFDVDPVFVRVAWVVVTIVPGAILLGVLAYVVAWLIIPEADPGSESVVESLGTDGTWRSRRLRRADPDRKMIAGVCGGVADYFKVDPTAVRVLWVILSIFPGAIVCGVLTYLVAWFVMPPAVAAANASPTPVPAE